MQQVQENVFTTDSFSQLDLHPHLVSGRKAVCLETCCFLSGEQVRELRCTFIHGDLNRLASTLPDFVVGF